VNSQLAAWITGIGAILFATMGVALSIREVRRKERRDAQAIIDGLEDRLLAQENEAIAWRRYVYDLRILMAEHGITSPDPPPLAEHVEGGSLLLDSNVARRGLRGFRDRRRRRQRNADDDSDTGTDGTARTDG
jgi:hypothetical protein